MIRVILFPLLAGLVIGCGGSGGGGTTGSTDGTTNGTSGGAPMGAYYGSCEGIDGQPSSCRLDVLPGGKVKFWLSGTSGYATGFGGLEGTLTSTGSFYRLHVWGWNDIVNVTSTRIWKNAPNPINVFGGTDSN